MGSGLCSRSSETLVQAVSKSEFGRDNACGSRDRAQDDSSFLASRVEALEKQLKRQALQLQEMQMALHSVSRDSRRTVSVLQYNVLAAYLGKNTQPWFLYGAEVSPAAREKIFSRFYAKGPDGKPSYPWPRYVEGILPPAEIAEIERIDTEHFNWEKRSIKLIDQIRSLDADVISLVELDHFPFFARCLDDGWDSIFQKRPRKASADGCGIFWRRSKFSLIDSKGFDMVDGSDDRGLEKRDRSCLMALLRWRASSSQQKNLVVISTHLAKDPYNRAQTAIRVRQVAQIMASLTEFTAAHSVQDCPVVLLGDLNAHHLGEIRGIARTVWQIKGAPIHKFLWGASDVNTGPTSITKARQCRIDAVQYLSSHMEVQDVAPVPRLPPGEVIPNDEHPSDHFPVCATFVIKDTYQKHREYARAWLECVAGREKFYPLADEELRDAFEFFDRDKSGQIHRHDLEEACLDLHCVQFSVDVQSLLLSCFPDKQISYENFLRAYEARLSAERMRCIGDLECAFRYFAGGKSEIQLSCLETAFREITPISFSDAEVKEMICRVTAGRSLDSQESVKLRDFCEVVCRSTFPRRNAPDLRSFTSARSSTKEIGSRLQDLHEAISPVKSPSARDVLRDLDRDVSTPLYPDFGKSPLALHE
eukprot:TRINITY_DN21916_c0_g1_i1.p1 TRINITY_DN21916_c0_g1~~TRINITY_DN21916_c0_g1_i1.p1  ORF type:complete len:647 (-),score=110.17 TRINITY_DN21916_c0_g1_i1:44-1984(-)